jgi:hypothetical protein
VRNIISTRSPRMLDPLQLLLFCNTLLMAVPGREDLVHEAFACPRCEALSVDVCRCALMRTTSTCMFQCAFIWRVIV